MHQNLYSTLSQYDKIVLVGGGTGGHIQPIVSLVHCLDNEETKYLWIGGSNSTEEKTAKSENIEFQSIPTLKLPTTRSWRSLLYPFYLIVGFGQAKNILLSIIQHSSTQAFQHSTCLFSKGGPGSVAIGFAAWSLGIPVYIHESDTVPGRSNRILGKIATRVFLGFETAKKYFDPKKCEVVEQILDPIFEGKVESRKLYIPPEGRKVEWNTVKPHILVICGSQGSRAIFEEILANLGGILTRGELIIILGKLNTDMRKDFEKVISTLNFPLSTLTMVDWISQADLAHLIQDTDLAITRGSATTLAELTNFQEPESRINNPQLIIIPLPYSAGNHQYYNAVEYEKMGYILLEQKNIKNLTKIIQEYV